MDNLVFAIPSLGRSERIKDCSISTLTRLQVEPSRIYIFVANEEEKNKYEVAVPDVKVVVGELGIGKQRRFINEYFPSGYRIVSMDDDISLVKKCGSKVVPLEGDLVQYASRAYDLCDSLGVRLWGIPDTANGMFMKDDAVHGLRCCAGGFYGEYSQETECQSERDHCEDMDKLLKHYTKYGGIVRFNNLGPKQKRYSGGGVVQHLGGIEERLAIYESEALDLCATYPGLIKVRNNYDVKKGVTRFKSITISRMPTVF